jgi:peptide chain release factor 1
MIDKVQKAIDRHEELERLMAAPENSGDPKKMEDLGREYTALGKNLPAFRSYLDTVRGLAEARQIVRGESDEELLELAREEIDQYEQELPELEERIKLLLAPKSPDDLKNAMMEIRAGTGGVEAGLFAGDLYRMYSHYAESRGWKTETLSFSEGDLGGIKEIIFTVTGDGAYGMLKFESGVHRVQRVPQTESQGRIHTSAASTAVFPEADDIEVNIDPNDLRIDVYRSSGPGGQSVNTTDSAVRIVHVPSGLTVTCQDEKSQHKNKAKALKVLQSRLYDMKQAELEAQETATRRSMVGTGDRSAKIRTYNFPQGRVTDHRINLTLYRLEQVLNGDLDELIDALLSADLNERIKQQQ